MSYNRRTSLTLVTPSTADPVSVVEFKLHQRISHTDEDVYLGGLIKAATRWCENYLGMAFVSQVWRQTLDCFPKSSDGSSEIKLYHPPLGSTTVTLAYTDSTGGTTTLASSDYRVDGDATPARITPIYGGTWPTGIREQAGAVTVTYTAGFGSTTGTSITNTPETIKQAIKMLAASWYENREAVTDGGMADVPLGVTALLNSESCGQYV